MKNKNAGFTLVELMITLTIFALLLALATPSLQELISNNRLQTQTNELVSALALGRSEALRRGARVTVCPSSNGVSCDVSGSWQQGWIVFADADNDKTSDELLRVADPLSGNTALSWDNSKNYVSFAGTGELRLYPSDSGFAGGEFEFTQSGSGKTRTVAVNAIGRVTIKG